MNIQRLLTEAERRPTLPPPEVRRYLREHSGLSQKAIADALGVRRPTVTRWEAGKRTPRGDLLSAYAELLQGLIGVAR